jgi:hypothetical protein
MALSQSAGRALGKLFSNLKNPRWLAKQTSETVASVTVLNYAGKQVRAAYKGYILHDTDKHIGDVYHCDDGHNYVVANGKTYRYDASTDSWYNA